MSKQQFKQYVEEFDFTRLFNRLGWSYKKHQDLVKLDDVTFTLDTVAEKSGFRILVCGPDSKGKIPSYSVRMKLDRAISRLYGEHLIIFLDKDHRAQLWQWVFRESGKPPQISESLWYHGQEPELLYQKASGLFFTLDEEENITIVDVTGKVRENFQQNREKVTKKFYEVFKKEHKNFLGFIEGIDSQSDQEWYASLMLNRLMFCYFIQKKGFLDNNKNYLRDKLQACQQKKGKNKFYSFYRDFLLALFHHGLGAPAHSSELKAELGNIPYLNGGLFNVHQLEKANPDIQIDDQAFARIFTFFDEYNWHLDTRVTASGKDINPDVIGYIFEKYINDRAQMGAYYTKEDITDYIGKNCILPYLFDETERHCPASFASGNWIWSMLKDSGDAYIYEAVKFGVDPEDIWGDLPDDIWAGLEPNQSDLVEKRRCWNRSAPSEVALPTEIWREVIERRKRYMEVRIKIENGEITSINDFITFNLNIRQFARDVIENCEDNDFLLHFYKSLAGDGKTRSAVSILDPTCGSGAFLFAAMNILEPLYEACLQRMEEFLAVQPRKHKYFTEVLEKVKAPEHPNREYFIYKSIILNNLYGVDIMHEAVEIAKLRLFLKLVATVEPNYKKPNLGLEPLPDIDYNIRTGNTLIGYASEKEIDQAFSGQLDFDDDAGKLKDRCEQVAMAFNRYKQIQLGGVENYQEFHQAKEELEERLALLNNDLNMLLHKQTTVMKFENWLQSHQPFHWFAEFYEIIHGRGGFDVIIGNPPYVESKTVNYKIYGYLTSSCGNLYAFILERTKTLLHQKARCGMIIPLSGHSTSRMAPLVKNFYNCFNCNFIMNISADAHPSILFPGVRFRLAIFLVDNHKVGVFTTKYLRWYAQERDTLFQQVKFNEVKGFKYHDVIPKISDPRHLAVLNKINTQSVISKYEQGNKQIYYHNTPIFWIRSHSFIPYFKSERDGEKVTNQLKAIFFQTEEYSDVASGLFCSSLFYVWWITISDCYHLNKPEISNFPFSFVKINSIAKFRKTSKELEEDLIAKSQRRVYQYATSGTVEYDEYYLKKSKSIIDKVDNILAQHYGFTPEELDFIINYDIKYRMGKELEGDEAES
ncbi:MAG: SAM-dependent methyltransferase [Clostridia bacterium]|nr:SAM-dependent methyltransferase [Clostridia bacterium]